MLYHVTQRYLNLQRISTTLSYVINWLYLKASSDSCEQGSWQQGKDHVTARKGNSQAGIDLYGVAKDICAWKLLPTGVIRVIVAHTKKKHMKL